MKVLGNCYQTISMRTRTTIMHRPSIIILHVLGRKELLNYMA